MDLEGTVFGLISHIKLRVEVQCGSKNVLRRWIDNVVFSFSLFGSRPMPPLGLIPDSERPHFLVSRTARTYGYLP